MNLGTRFINGLDRRDKLPRVPLFRGKPFLVRLVELVPPIDKIVSCLPGSRSLSRQPVFSIHIVTVITTLLATLASAQVNVLTAHNDNARTGLNSNEIVLNPITVSSNGFGKIFSQPVDGPIYGQPLFVSNLPVPNKGVHNAVFVATMHDSVYAFDGDNALGTNGPPLWHTSFINPAAGITASLTTDATDSPGQDCQTFSGEIGIVGTPVIDLASQTLYVVARTKEPLPPPNNPTLVQYHRLHALDLSTGLEHPNSPVIVDGVVPGSGVGSSAGFIHFDQKRHIQRPGLLLVNGIVYVAFCSYCDLDPYHGWIMGYDAQSLQQVAVFNVSPNAQRGGIWMGGSGLAADTNGAVYCVTGNGAFDLGPNPQDFGDTFLKLVQTTNLVVADYFTPYDQSSMDAGDEDLGASGTILLPDSAGSPTHPHLMVGGGKLGKLYLIDRDAMGHFNPVNDSQIVQEITMFSFSPSPPHFFGIPAFFKNRVYLQVVNEYLKAYSITNASINATPFSQTTDIIGYRGTTPSISANGTNGGLVWQIYHSPSLRAYNAEDLSQRLYDSASSAQAGLPDGMNSYSKFCVPTVANGKVYLGNANSLVVFGLRSIIKSITRIPGSGVIHIVYTAPLGVPTYVQVSPDLANWTNLGPGTSMGNGIFFYEVAVDPAARARFYRVQ
jgi:hypothetical protein